MEAILELLKGEGYESLSEPSRSLSDIIEDQLNHYLSEEERKGWS